MVKCRSRGPDLASRLGPGSILGFAGISRRWLDRGLLCFQANSDKMCEKVVVLLETANSIGTIREIFYVNCNTR